MGLMIDILQPNIQYVRRLNWFLGIVLNHIDQVHSFLMIHLMEPTGERLPASSTKLMDVPRKQSGKKPLILTRAIDE